MLALVMLIAILVRTGPLDVDRGWSEAMHHLRTPLLTGLALVLNWLGRGIGRAIGLTLVGLLLLRRRRWLALVVFAVAESLAPLLSTLLKALVDRARPPDGLVHPVGASFPSVHTTYAGATCVALVLLFSTPGTRRSWWWMLASLGIVGMAWSRTYLQVHWLTDVIAGALLGTGVSLLVFAIAQRHVNLTTSLLYTPPTRGAPTRTRTASNHQSLKEHVAPACAPPSPPVRNVWDRVRTPKDSAAADAKSTAMTRETRVEQRLEHYLRLATTPRGAAIVIAVVTTLITLGAGLLMTVVDSADFPSLGGGLWWAVQTVTTVGYGDHVPETATGQIMAALVMLLGIGFITVITASITSAFVERSRKKVRAEGDPEATAEQLRKIDARLERIEAALGARE
jgi:membrane-associated phospholipid phosphatase